VRGSLGEPCRTVLPASRGRGRTFPGSRSTPAPWRSVCGVGVQEHGSHPAFMATPNAAARRTTGSGVWSGGKSASWLYARFRRYVRRSVTTKLESRGAVLFEITHRSCHCPPIGHAPTSQPRSRLATTGRDLALEPSVGALPPQPWPSARHCRQDRPRGYASRPARRGPVGSCHERRRARMLPHDQGHPSPGH
jgi:hypothetical protein